VKGTSQSAQSHGVRRADRSHKFPEQVVTIVKIKEIKLKATSVDFEGMYIQYVPLLRKVTGIEAISTQLKSINAQLNIFASINL